MDRKSQLRNVAFGGDWSEAIEPRERMAAALDLLDAAVHRTVEEDLRLVPDVTEALAVACKRAPKSAEHASAWRKALAFPDPSMRSQELGRLAALIRAAVGVG